MYVQTSQHIVDIHVQGRAIQTNSPTQLLPKV